MTDLTSPSYDKCPKCGEAVSNSEECLSCGLLFRKYQAAGIRRDQLNRQQNEKRARQRYLAGLTALFLYLLFLHIALCTGLIIKHDAVLRGIARTVFWVQSWHDIDRERMYNPSDKHFIERARRATVLIETPVGAGSGFFISPSQVVTNRHVIDYDIESVAEHERKIARESRIVELEGKKINELKKHLNELRRGPSREQLALVIEAKEEAFAVALAIQQEKERELARLKSRMASPVIKVYLYDGTELLAGYVEKSPNFDLALINLHQSGTSFLEPADFNGILQQGDEVFTIGSPKGLVNTVTSGIFSGYRWKTDTVRYLQIDAPINPGSSGGPLINRFGEVLGVNTSKYLNTEGIGFALPIETVFAEFRYALRY